MNHQELYNLLKTVRKNIRCPQCGKEYGFSEIKIRGIAEFIVFLELHCQNHMPVLATVALSQKNTLGKNKTVVDSNDVINIYSFLKDFRGGFENIFSGNKKEQK